jgi:hypothetical protein
MLLEKNWQMNMRNAVIFFIAMRCGDADAFVQGDVLSLRPASTGQVAHYKRVPIKPMHSHFSPQMSSIPDDDDYRSLPSPSQLLKSLKESLPPLPEDQTALSGDVLAMFVYSFLDHTGKCCKCSVIHRLKLTRIVY